jgi:hypothetical protein
MKVGVMEVVTVVQVLTERDSAGKDCSSKREDNGMRTGRTRMPLVLSTIARYFTWLHHEVYKILIPGSLS